LEIGYGLEGALPDATCKSILHQQVAPFFKAGDFYAGYNAGLNSIIAASKGEYTPAASDAATRTGGVSKNAKYWLFIVPFLLAGFVGAFHPFAGGVTGGIGAGALAWLVINPIAAFILGIVGFFVGLIAKDLIAGFANGSGSGGGSSGGGYSGGDSGSSYSGGGGSSGGGGASDSY
jgi:uncharacterized protein